MKHTSINKIKIVKGSVEVVNEWKLRVMPPGGDQIFFQLQALKAGEPDFGGIFQWQLRLSSNSSSHLHSFAFVLRRRLDGHCALGLQRR